MVLMQWCNANVGLKIKVKAGAGAAAAAKPSKDTTQDLSDDVVTNSRMLKRKRLTPPGSPAVSKRPPRGESPHTANGDPGGEPNSKKITSSVTDLNAAKPDAVAKPEDVAPGSESLDPGTESVLEKGVNACSNSHVTDADASGVETNAISAEKADADADVVAADQAQDMATGVQVSSSLAASSVTLQAEDEKLHTIPSHAGMNGYHLFKLCIVSVSVLFPLYR